MDPLRRRLFHLLGLAVLFPATSWLEGIEALGLSTEEAPWRAVFRTTFPHDMSLKDYKEIRKAFRNERAAEDFYESFRRQGKILRAELDFAGTHADWRVVFRNKEAAEEWLSRSENSGANDERRLEAMGFRRDLHRWGRA